MQLLVGALLYGLLYYAGITWLIPFKDFVFNFGIPLPLGAFAGVGLHYRKASNLFEEHTFVNIIVHGLYYVLTVHLLGEAMGEPVPAGALYCPVRAGGGC